MFNRIKSVLVLIFIIVSVFFFAEEKKHLDKADALVSLLVKKDYQKVFSMFNDDMKKVLPLSNLITTWEKIDELFGKFVKKISVASNRINNNNVLLFYAAEFEKGNIDIKILFNEKMEVAGLYFSPGKAILHSQNPVKPYPYDEREVLFENKKAGIKIAGTLTLPRVDKKIPVVLLITGSGQQDRDETLFGHKPFLVLSDYLTRNGIAVLRIDDRGIGGSTGDFSISTTADFAEDIKSGVEFLKSVKEIDPGKIGLIGHSEGGMIAPIVASQTKDIAFIVLMAGPGLTGKEISLTQSEAILKASKVDQSIIDREMLFKRKYLEILINEKDNETAKQKFKEEFSKYFEKLTDVEKMKAGDPEKYLNILINTIFIPWQKYFIAFDPAPYLSKLTCPVLAINGSRDLQVLSKENLSAIDAALKNGKNKNYTIKEFPGLNHLFQECTTGLISEYEVINQTISPEVLKVISDWIKEHTK